MPMSSQLLFLLPVTDAVDRRRCSDLRTSPFEFMFPLDTLIACKVGLYRSPWLVFRIRSKKGTDPFFGRPWVAVWKAGWEAFLGIAPAWRFWNSVKEVFFSLGSLISSSDFLFSAFSGLILVLSPTALRSGELPLSELPLEPLCSVIWCMTESNSCVSKLVK